MIIVRLSGGMGNQMFQYAFGRALSLKHGVPLKLNIQTFLDQSKRPFRKGFAIRSYDLDMFTIAAEIARPEELPFLHRMYWKGGLMLILDALRRRILFHTGRERFFQFDAHSRSFGPATYLVGEWQSPQYFAGYEEVIRADFSLRVPVSAEIQKLGHEIRNGHSVCVHVRRADFVGNTLHDTGIGQTYYSNALQEIAKRTPIDTLYIFSDDSEWCRDNLSFPYPTTVVGVEYAGDRATGHFWLMQQCSSFVICNSSFSWWAAWLATAPEKVVIAPKRWFTDQSIDTHDLIPPQWIRI